MRSLVVVLALLLAACSSGSHHTAARPTTTILPSTVPTTTTTATPPQVTEAALVGIWRPASVAGYQGPLTAPPLGVAPLIHFNGKGVWSGSDGCHIFSGTYQLQARGTLQLADHPYALIGCEPNVGRPVDTAVRAKLSDGRLRFFGRDGHQLAWYERATVNVNPNLSDAP